MEPQFPSFHLTVQPSPGTPRFISRKKSEMSIKTCCVNVDTKENKRNHYRARKEKGESPVTENQWRRFGQGGTIHVSGHRHLDCEVHIRGLGTNCLIKKAQQWLHFTAYTDCFILAHGLILLVERRLHSQLCLKKVRPSSTLLNVNKIDLFS